MTKISIVIADDHPFMRSGLREILSKEEDFDVVAEAANGEEAYLLAKKLLPTVLLLDMDMPVLTGVEVASKMRAEEVPVYILALSAYDDEAYVRGLLENGAAGYITKDKHPILLTEAIRAVARGEGRWFVTPKLKSTADLPVSEREQAVLRLMARGYANEEIAEQLFIAENTVRNHVTNIYAKLGVSTWRQAIAWAWESGLMHAEA